MPRAGGGNLTPKRRINMRELLTILMRRDGLTREEAIEILREAHEAVLEAIDNGEDPEEVFMDITGLEPDYIMDII